MNYQEITDWMFNQLPMYQFQGASAYKEDLTNINLLIAYLNHPHKRIKCIHVGGTNGKGSTSHMLASILQEAGYKVGLYTSPHLKDYRERIKINGLVIPETFVCEFIEANKNFFTDNEVSFFEMSVGLTFDYFAKEKVDIAVIEVGMGGRLDATNVISPLVSVITNIGSDHTQFLGNTLASIAFEKAGIIKPKTDVVIGEYTPETKPVFLAKAKECNAKIHFASDYNFKNYPSDLLGDYQLHNKKTVLATINVLKAHNDFTIQEIHIEMGIGNAAKNTGLQGRWQQIDNFPKTICDTAHNQEGLVLVLQQIAKETFDNLHIVFGLVNDKNLEAILSLLPKNAMYYFCQPKNPRAMDAEILWSKAQEFGLNGGVYISVAKAYQNAKSNAKNEDFIYIGGSTFVVAEIL